MFKCFFPNPKWFFLSVVIYAVICCTVWYAFNLEMGLFLGFDLTETKPEVGLKHFVSDSFLFFYGYYLVATALFAIFWFKLSPHRWQWWAIPGSSLILFSTYFSVQLSVAINNWRRPFGDLLQSALKQPGSDSVRSVEEVATFTTDLLDLILIFTEIAFLAIVMFATTRFFVSHFIFRWRTAMNDYYTAQWDKVRHIEGASQRIQEDTMRFASIMENLGVSVVDSVMTLFAFLPVLWGLSQYVSELPIIGSIPHPLVYAAIIWAVFGTGLLAIVGIKLPGLKFQNQRVEAAFRKELVYGEDDSSRAEPLALKTLFTHVRTNYFRIFFHYSYFNVARMFFLQADNIFSVIILIPTIALGTITYGIFSQISSAFGQVSSSFQYLVHSWDTIIELLSVQKRLASFEAAMENQPLPAIDRPINQ